MKSLLQIAILCCAPAAWLCAQSGQELKQGRKSYDAACAECHGPEGRGDGPKARKLGFRPRDFTLGAFKCRCTPSGQLPTDDDLYRVITNGMPGTPMPGHEKTLSPEERHAVIHYIKTMIPRFKSEPPPQCMAIPDAPTPAVQALFEGKQLYRILGCGKCHGKSGRGDGPASAGLKDDWGQPIRAYNFTVTKKFKCGGEDRDFYRVLHTGMNGSPMPSFAAAFEFGRDTVTAAAFEGTLSPAEVQEVTTYLNGQPDSAALRSLSSGARRELVDRRTWSLIQYLRSLLRP
jgi:cytochrome c oxidase cbb3-type subunit 2